MELHFHTIDIPPVNDAKELMGAVFCTLSGQENREPRMVTMDLPRSMPKNRLGGIYSALEQIKKGKVYDLRYRYRVWWFEVPSVWVFSNDPPQMWRLRQDRWNVMTFNADRTQLIPYEPVTADNNVPDVPTF